MLDSSLVKLIENNNIVDYEDGNLRLNLEPSDYRDVKPDEKTSFHLTARITQNLQSI